MKRKTIKTPFGIEGTGLHKGKKSGLKFSPQPEALGIRFLNPEFRSPVTASVENIHSTVRGTNLTNGKDVVYTVEHVLSPLFAFGIDDADIEIYGEEPPALDGSAGSYAELIRKAGFTEKDEKARVFEFSEPLIYRNGDSFYKLSESDRFEVDCSFENPHPLIKEQRLRLEITPASYEKEIAPARTFGFEREIDLLRKNGLALGGSLENAVVLSETGLLNKEPLRFKDEFVRHKILDLLGDLKLLGLRFERARITALKPSHEGNINFARLLQSAAN
ncbi:MAG: UDP-3-O-[3-hydroxymyristoyl] N-acetylglucosamine deacetylase [Elusimicrobia bacterium CG08_land_8_20_14_0_20_51_18]|nr:MAG: UDP-3-O-[3-hydroxymyristoyl] N-acetylglucosamine deacetylase [Elusimicrobia bacterium CG08_land_8_20_14_0_20_51_18]